MELTVGEIVARLLVATLSGSIIGADREARDKPAGLRTHALVALGAAIMTVVAVGLSSGEHFADAVSRVIQGIVAGVGFLGGGAILKSDREGVQGLTTAASIWVVAALGIACGGGYWIAALTGLLVAVLLLTVGHWAEDLVRRVFRTDGREAPGAENLLGDENK